MRSENSENKMVEYPKWSKVDTTWMLSLFGTAIGAGVLFLPIKIGVGGLIPLVIMLLVAFPMTYYAHRALCRFILASKSVDGDVTNAAQEFFGAKAGKWVTKLYFLTIFPILLIYSVTITNTVHDFMLNQLHFTPPPRIILSFILIVAIMLIIYLGLDAILKSITYIVYPFVIILIAISIYLIPKWNSAILVNAAETLQFSTVLDSFWTIIPIIVFSFSHMAIVSSFAIATQKQYGQFAEQKCSSIMRYSTLLMVVVVMFLVLSCTLAIEPSEIKNAYQQNSNILSYLANTQKNPIISYLAVITAFFAIFKSFLGHYLGAKEGLNGLILQKLAQSNMKIKSAQLNRITFYFILVSCWLTATLNPNVLDMIEILTGPLMAMLLFLMPMYAIYKVPALAKYRTDRVSNFFIIFTGWIAVSTVIYKLVFYFL